MEPDHEDREDPLSGKKIEVAVLGPQWSPIMKTGKTGYVSDRTPHELLPQWSPIMKTGKTWSARPRSSRAERPQWSPIMKTGKTSDVAAMLGLSPYAAMEPDHEDREDRAVGRAKGGESGRRNGARS